MVRAPGVVAGGRAGVEGRKATARSRKGERAVVVGGRGREAESPLLDMQDFFYLSAVISLQDGFSSLAPEDGLGVYVELVPELSEKVHAEPPLEGEWRAGHPEDADVDVVECLRADRERIQSCAS